jgi:uncharacterized protein
VLWVVSHPFLALGFYLLAEAFLPVQLQPSAWVLRGAIRVYQVTLSPVLGTQCKFQPTCSHYGLGCIRKYGTLRGGLLTTWRILRCSPFTHGGEDPIP